MKTVLYARVSTADQTIAHQRTKAEAAGFKIDTVVADGGVSGVHTRLADRPEGRRLFDLLRAGDTFVVRWVDRLGCNYADVCDTIREFMRRGVVIRTVINGLTFDGATRDPMQQAVRDALIAFMAATAQAQADQASDVRSRQLRPAPPARSPCGMIHAKCGRATLSLRREVQKNSTSICERERSRDGFERFALRRDAPDRRDHRRRDHQRRTEQVATEDAGARAGL